MQILLVLLTLIMTCSTLSAEVLIFAADPFCPYTCDENEDQGAAADIVRQIYESEGYKVVYRSLPWSRALIKAEAGEITGVIGAAKKDLIEVGLLLPEEEVSMLRACFYKKAESNWKFHGIDSLKKIKLGLIQDYRYEELGPDFKEYIDNRKNRKMIQYISSEDSNLMNFHKLLHGRIDTTLNDRNAASYMLKKENIENRITEAGCFDKTIPIYIGFGTSNPRAGEYTELFDQGIRKLRESGELNKILFKYGIKDWKHY